MIDHIFAAIRPQLIILTIVYLEKKKKKADKPNYDHVVQVGESMHSIAQKYGIQIKSLYKMNKKHKDYIPEEGDVLKLR